VLRQCTLIDPYIGFDLLHIKVSSQPQLKILCTLITHALSDITLFLHSKKYVDTISSEKMIIKLS